MSDQQINELENRIFKLEQGLIASSFRGDIAYKAIAAISLLLKDNDQLQKVIIDVVSSFSIKPDTDEMSRGLFEAEKKHAISVLLSVERESAT